MKPGDLLRLRRCGRRFGRPGMTLVVWCDSPAGEIAGSDFLPAGTPALLVDFSPWGNYIGDRLFVVVNSRTGLVWSEEVEPL